MAYAVTADVQACLPALQPGGNWYAPLDSAQLAAHGTGIAAEIDATLAGAGFTTPVTSPASALEYLKVVNAWGWAAEVQRARFRDSQQANAESAWKFWHDKYRTALAGLPSWAEAILGSGVMPASFATNYPDRADEPDWGTNERPVFVDSVKF